MGPAFIACISYLMKTFFVPLFISVLFVGRLTLASMSDLAAPSIYQSWSSNHGFFLFGSTTHECSDAAIEVIKTENDIELKCVFRKCKELVATGGANISQIGCPANTKFQVNGTNLISADGLKVGEVSDRAISVTPQFGKTDYNFQLVVTADGKLMFDYEMYFKMNDQMVPIKLMSTLSPVAVP